MTLPVCSVGRPQRRPEIEPNLMGLFSGKAKPSHPEPLVRQTTDIYGQGQTARKRLETADFAFWAHADCRSNRGSRSAESGVGQYRCTTEFA